MLSTRCEQRNKTIIPSLLSQYGAVLASDTAIVDLSTAENWSLKEMLAEKLQTAKIDLFGEV